VFPPSWTGLRHWAVGDSCWRFLGGVSPSVARSLATLAWNGLAKPKGGRLETSSIENGPLFEKRIKALHARTQRQRGRGEHRATSRPSSTPPLVRPGSAEGSRGLPSGDAPRCRGSSGDVRSIETCAAHRLWSCCSPDAPAAARKIAKKTLKIRFKVDVCLGFRRRIPRSLRRGLPRRLGIEPRTAETGERTDG
jgi:hypothetical protein